MVGLYLNPPENAIILCVDEKSQIQALERSQPVLPIIRNIPERQSVDYSALSEFVRRLKNLYFIIFNYDRTLEYYFYNSIMRFYKISKKISDCLSTAARRVPHTIYTINMFLTP